MKFNYRELIDEVRSKNFWSRLIVVIICVLVLAINYNTFESLTCPGLYITGELLDVDGKSGGFNLHFAWASGIIAARALSEEL